MGIYELNILNTENITPEESFMNAYVEKKHESEQVYNSTKKILVILDAKL